MGEGSLAHLASAATVAASAAEMKVTDPRPLLAMIDQDRYGRILGERKPRCTPELHVGVGQEISATLRPTPEQWSAVRPAPEPD